MRWRDCHYECQRGIFAFEKAQTLLRCAGVTFGGKSNQNRGGCDSPTPHKRCTSVECYVCYKSRKFKTSLTTFTRSTNFFVIFVKIFQPATPLKYFYSPQTPLFIFGAKPRTPAISQRRLCHHCEIGALCAGRLSAARYKSIR